MKKFVFLKSFHIFAFFAFFMLVFSCKREPILTEEFQSNFESRELTPPPPTGFYSMTYTDHPTLTFAQYCKKARKNSLMTGINASFGDAVIGQRSTYRASLLDWKKPEFDYFLTQLGSATYYVENFTYTDEKKYAIFRNWNINTYSVPFFIRPVDMTFAPTSPFYYQSGYISCNLDPYKINIVTYGPPYKLTFKPSSLRYVYKGSATNPGHIGIEPVSTNYTKSALQIEMDKITVELAH